MRIVDRHPSGCIHADPLTGRGGPGYRGGVKTTNPSQVRLGFKIVIFPAVCMMAAVQAIERSVSLLKERETDWHDGPVLSPMDLFRRVGFDWWYGLEQRFTGA